LSTIAPILELKLTILSSGIWHDNGIDNENRWRVPFQGQLEIVGEGSYFLEYDMIME